MKRTILLFVTLFTFLTLSTAFSQVNFNGWWQSNMYVYQDLQENRYWNYYQGLQFRLSPETNPDLYLNTFFRVAYRHDLEEWQERVYNLYGSWELAQNYKIRLGRQFMYRGVINGTVDAVSLSGRIGEKLVLTAVAGTEAPFSRELDILSWDEGNVIGVYGSYKLPKRNTFELSYYQKERNSELYWQQLGTALTGYLNRRLNYYIRFDYNLLSEDYQALRARLMYFQDRWSLSAEYNSQRPRIYEDSFFNIFEITAYNQLRASFLYQLSDYNLGLQVLHTAMDASDVYILFKDNEDENDLRFVGTVGHNRYGTLGIVFQTGYGGENVGYFADLRYELMKNVTLRFFNSYYNFERTTTNISEDALAFMAGLGYQLKEQIRIDGELQQSSNNLYKNDLRGLLRVTWLFRNR